MRFWNYSEQPGGGTELRIEGEIAQGTTWWGDEVTPKQFRQELQSHPGDITVYINSPGGDTYAASAIYTDLREHKGKVTVKIAGIAASAASIIAMAGDEVLISPTAYMMVHLPWSFIQGNSAELRDAADWLDEIAEGVINAYQLKTGMERERLLELMQKETYMSAASAVALGFADGILYQEDKPQAPATPSAAAAATASAQMAIPNSGSQQPEGSAPDGVRCVFSAGQSASAMVARMCAEAKKRPAPKTQKKNEDAQERAALCLWLTAAKANQQGGNHAEHH